jgi:hypothetical protein
MVRAAEVFNVLFLGICGLLFAIPVTLAGNRFLDARAGRAFERIQPDDSEAAVVALLGEPDVERPCGDNLWWGGDYDYRGRNDGRCVTEVRYEYFLSAWAVGYSADRRVVSKYHYFSE